MIMNKYKSIQIVGGGTFGLSTAYYLANEGHTNITVIDREEVPSKFSAGYDLNKIIRCEYPDEFYTDIGLEAIDEWESPEFLTFFHKVGYVNCNSAQATEKSLGNTKAFYNNLKKNPKFPKDCLEYLDSEDSFKRCVPMDIDFKGWTGYFNKHAGYAHALKAMKYVAEECRQNGVKFVVDRIQGLSISDDSTLNGVVGKDGKLYTADLTILALGAHITSLMPELGVFVSPQSWSVGHLKLSKEEASPFKNMPVFNCRDIGFCFEPDEDSNTIKMCNESAGWINYNPESKERYSVPTETNEGVCEDDKKALEAQAAIFFPQLKGKEVVDRKICWCCDRSNSDFVIDYHPKYSNLLLTTADSGHAFKMLPIFGKWVVDKINGTLVKEKEDRWRWFKDEEARDSNLLDIETVSWRLGKVLNLHNHSRS